MPRPGVVPPTIKFNANHPFVFSIYKGKNMIFMGNYVKPKRK